MQSKYIKFVVLSFVLVSFALSETPSYQLLTYPFGSRSAAMGGTRAVDASGSYEIQANPASASFVNGIQGQTGVINHLRDIQGYSVAGVLPLDSHHLSVELVYFDYGTFDKTDIHGNSYDGTFGFHELASSLGYAFKFSENIRLGGRIARYQRVADSQSIGDFYYDMGVVYHLAQDSLTLGMHLASAGLGETTETFPTQLHVGSSKILSHLPLRINLEGVYGFNDKMQLILGAEVFVHPVFTVRLGMNSNRFDLQTGVTEADFIAGASAGFALEWQGLLIESATQSFGEAGWVSQMSLGFRL